MLRIIKGRRILGENRYDAGSLISAQYHHDTMLRRSPTTRFLEAPDIGVPTRNDWLSRKPPWCWKPLENLWKEVRSLKKTFSCPPREAGSQPVRPGEIIVAEAK